VQCAFRLTADTAIFADNMSLGLVISTGSEKFSSSDSANRDFESRQQQQQAADQQQETFRQSQFSEEVGSEKLAAEKERIKEASGGGWRQRHHVGGGQTDVSKEIGVLC
jgi:hypothetical protein